MPLLLGELLVMFSSSLNSSPVSGCSIPIKIFNKDYEEVLKADIFFGILDGRVPDEGLAVELGIAYANKKRCYGFKTDARSIELDMDLNPMITGCLDKLFYNLDGDAAVAELREYLANNKL